LFIGHGQTGDGEKELNKKDEEENDHVKKQADLMMSRRSHQT